MQGLIDDFHTKHADITVSWVTLEENVLRRNVTTDIATRGGQHDVLTIGTYAVPIWGQQGWLVSLNDLPADHDVDDLLPAIRGGLTVDGNLYASPGYGASSMIMNRRDLMGAAGLTMPDAPTWADIEKAAAAMTNKDTGIYGICLRAKAGWGENMAVLTTLSNSSGARWFDESWKPEVDQPDWKATLDFCLNLMNNHRPGLDGSNRQPKFIIPSVRDAQAAGGKVERLALVSALWCRYCCGETDTGTLIPPNDPNWVFLQAQSKAARFDPLVWLRMKPVYGDLADDPRVAIALNAVWSNSTAKTLQDYFDS